MSNVNEKSVEGRLNALDLLINGLRAFACVKCKKVTEGIEYYETGCHHFMCKPCTLQLVSWKCLKCDTPITSTESTPRAKNWTEFAARLKKLLEQVKLAAAAGSPGQQMNLTKKFVLLKLQEMKNRDAAATTGEVGIEVMDCDPAVAGTSGVGNEVMYCDQAVAGTSGVGNEVMDCDQAVAGTSGVGNEVKDCDQAVAGTSGVGNKVKDCDQATAEAGGAAIKLEEPDVVRSFNPAKCGWEHLPDMTSGSFYKKLSTFKVFWDEFSDTFNSLDGGDPIPDSAVLKKANPKWRNVKGESALHVSSRKGDIACANELRKFKFLVNAQDNNAWTALHEAAKGGHADICELLMKSGALLEVRGGDEKWTALHIAASEDYVDVVTVLLSHGARRHPRDRKGLTPAYYSVSDEVRNLLNDPRLVPLTKIRAYFCERNKERILTNFDKSSMVVYGDNLGTNSNYVYVIYKTRFELQTSLVLIKRVTHMVVRVDAVTQRCKLSINYLKALLLGVMIVDISWLISNVPTGVVDPKPYMILGPSGDDAPRRALHVKLLMHPKLFEGCVFFLRGMKGDYLYKGVVFAKYQLIELIELAGGRSCAREPLVDNNRSILFHAPTSHPLCKCGQYVLYFPGDRQVKYNFETLKAKPIEWFLCCLETFKIQEG